MKQFVITVMILFLYLGVNAQYYSTGTDRACTEWKQIDTDDFKLVYPQSIEKEAVRLARTLNRLKNLEGNGLRHNTHKIPILLHAETAVSNGYVAWAPKRSEFYTTAPDGNQINDWLTHLLSHEYRHVVQLDKVGENIPRIFQIFLGEQSVPLVLAFRVPRWFMEGDAVLTETLLSSAGRGRSGKFLQVMRAYLAQGKKWYDYDKFLLGSYKDYVPNAYHLGYSLVSNTMKNYGNDCWANELEYIADGALGIMGKNIWRKSKQDDLYKSIVAELEEKDSKKIFKKDKFTERWRGKRYWGKAQRLYNDNLCELQARTMIEQVQLDTTTYEVLSPQKRCYTEYKEPKILSDGRIIALKSGIDDYPQFVVFNNKEEDKLFTPGNVSGGVRLNGNYLLWTEVKPHIRWGEVSKNVIWKMDVRQKTVENIQSSLNLFMPYFDEKNNRILAVAKHKDYSEDIVVLNGTTAELLFVEKYTNIRVLDPVFVDDNKVAYLFVNNGMGIELMDIQTREKEQLMFFPNVKISDFSLKNGVAYFIADFNGKDDYYKFQLSDKKLTKLTETSFGMGQAVLGKNNVIYSNYTAKGYEVVEMSMSKSLNKNVEQFAFQEDGLLKILGAKEIDAVAKSRMDDTTKFSPRKYSRLAHLFNFHSWAPFMLDPYEGTLDVGISAQSQNLLSTMSLNGGYRLKNGDNYGKFFAKAVYSGWFPILSSQVSYGRERTGFYGLVKGNNRVDTMLLAETRNRLVWENKVSLPFNFSKGKYKRNMLLGLGYELQKDSDITTEKYYSKQKVMGDRRSRSSQNLNYTVLFSNKHKWSLRDLQTPFGQVFMGQFSHNPANANTYNYSMEAIFFVPSVFKHHGMRFYGGYQYFNKMDRLFDMQIHTPRGMSEVVGTENYSFSADYLFPVAYPEWNISGFSHFKRLKTALFFDAVQTKDRGYEKQAVSYGAEFRFDVHFFRLPLPIDMGVRLGYEHQTSRWFSDFLFSLSI